MNVIGKNDLPPTLKSEKYKNEDLSSTLIRYIDLTALYFCNLLTHFINIVVDICVIIHQYPLPFLLNPLSSIHLPPL